MKLSQLALSYGFAGRLMLGTIRCFSSMAAYSAEAYLQSSIRVMHQVDTSLYALRYKRCAFVTHCEKTWLGNQARPSLFGKFGQCNPIYQEYDGEEPPQVPNLLKRK